MPTIKVIKDNAVRIYDSPPKLKNKLKRELTFANPEYESALNFGRSTRGIKKNIKLFDEEFNYLAIPRGSYHLLEEEANKLQLKIELENNTTVFPFQATPKSLTLRDYQKPWLEDLLSQPQGIGVAPPGAGKTVMGLKAYELLGQPCLWLTHTRRLAQQALDRAKTFLGVEGGFIGSGKSEIKHFTVGLIPTLIKRDLEELKDQFGLIITDECHHVPAVTFLKVTSSFSARYNLGLTATPYRDDQLEDIMFASLGPQLAYLDKKILRQLGKLMTPTVYLRNTKLSYPYDPTSYKYGYQKLLKYQAANEERNKLIAHDVLIESMLDDNNICIVLVARIEHGEALYEELQPMIGNTGLVHSKMGAKKSDAVLRDFESGKLKVLIATYKMLAEGFDYQPTNRLFLTAPFKARSLIEQACGRIERVVPGKKNAIVYDYRDVHISVLEKQAQKRMEIYELNENPCINME